MSPAYPAFSFAFAPTPPTPFPAGRGTLGYFMQGASPLASPRLNPWFAAKATGSGSLWAVPVAKERGDRGRGTSAFEMVLSPGAGRASAVGGKPPLGTGGGVVIRRLPGQAPRRVPPTPAEPVPCPAQPRGCKGRSPLHKKTLILPLPRRGRGLGGYPSPSGKGGKNKAKGRVDRQQRRQAPRRVPGRHLNPSKKSKARKRALTSPLNNYIREKFLGVWGLLSRSPQRIPDASLTPPPPYYRKSGRSWRPASAAERADGTSEKSATSECGLRAGSS